MSGYVVEGLSDHPFVARDDNDRKVEFVSWHEAVCDLARHMDQNPERYADIPPTVADYLETINIQVRSLTAYITSA